MPRPHTPGPWEFHLYEEDSAELDDGIAAWVANHRLGVFVADVIEARNAAAIAAVPAMIDLLERLVRYGKEDPSIETEALALLARIRPPLPLQAVQ